MQTAIDPVCGGQLEAEQAEGAGLYSDYDVTRFYFCSPSSRQEKRRFYFCSPQCKAAFEAAPGFYSGLADDEARPGDASMWFG